jgi:hypothetical protein
MMPSLGRTVVLVAAAGIPLAAAIGLGATQIASRGEFLRGEPSRNEPTRAVERAAEWRMAANDRSGDFAGTTGTIGGAGGARDLPLSDEQRGHIFDGIMKLHDAPVASLPATTTALPRSVALQDLPASVTSDLPIVQGYKFVKLDDRILLVRPADRSVVAVMPRYHIILD